MSDFDEYLNELRKDPRFLDYLRSIDIPPAIEFRSSKGPALDQMIKVAERTGMRDGILFMLATLSNLNPEEFKNG